MKLGENIRLYRTGAGMTQEQLGEKVGVSAQAVSKWESEASLPDTALLPEIAEALSVSVDTLFGYTAASRDSALLGVYRYYMKQDHARENSLQYSWEMLFHSFMIGWISRYRGGGEISHLESLPERESVCITENQGYIQGWYTPGSELFIMAPRPEEGWKDIFSDDEKTQKIFTALGDPDICCAIRWLCTHPNGYQFLFPVLMRDTGLPIESEEKVRRGLLDLRLLTESVIVIDGVAEKTYRYDFQEPVLGMWLLCHNYLYRSQNYMYCSGRCTKPVLPKTADGIGG